MQFGVKHLAPCVGDFAGGYEPETLKELALIAKAHRVQTIIVETNFGDGMFEQLLKPVLLKHGVKVEIVGKRHQTMKERRILDALEPVISGHRLIVDPSVIVDDHATIQKYDVTNRSDKSLFHRNRPVWTPTRKLHAFYWTGWAW